MLWGKRVVVYVACYVLTGWMLYASLFLSPHMVSFPLFAVLRPLILFFATLLLTRYTLSMLLVPWDRLRRKKSTATFKRSRDPLVSVLIPAWNEEVGLLSTIRSLLESTYRHMELVVVNDGSTDSSDEKMRHFLRQYGAVMRDVPHIPIVYHYQPNGGKGAALNKALLLSRGEILLSIDADCLVSPTAVEAFVRAFDDPSVSAAVGQVRIGNTRTLVGTVQYLEYLFSFLLKQADSLLGTIYIVGGAAGAFRRSVFEQVGTYDVGNITEDIELSTRIQRAGLRIVYVPDALIVTEGASTIGGLMKQRLRWKRGRFQTFWQHRALFFSLDRKHNKVLTWFVLPLAVLGDVQLGFELVFLLVLYLFSVLSGDYSAFVSGILLVSLLFFLSVGENTGSSPWQKNGRHGGGWKWLWLAPIGWLLFYLCTYVETYALFRGLWLFLRRREVRWQHWQRRGLHHT